MTGSILDGCRVSVNVTKWGLVLVLMLLLLIVGVSGCSDGVGGALASGLLWWSKW